MKSFCEKFVNSLVYQVFCGTMNYKYYLFVGGKNFRKLFCGVL